MNSLKTLINNNPMRLIIYSSLLVIFSSVSHLFGQQDDGASDSTFVLKPPYYMKRVPAGSVWSVALDQSTDASAPSDPKKKPEEKLATIKGENYMLRRDYKSDGSVWDTWCVGNYQVILYPDQKKWIVCAAKADASAANPNFIDYSQSDFPELTWINANTFIGLDKFKEIKCLKFKGSFKFPSDEFPTELTAFINRETRYPVALVETDGTHVYTFDVNGASESVPIKVKQLLSQLSAQNKIVRAAPAMQ